MRFAMLTDEEQKPHPSTYGFSCITVTTVMQENLLCEPHAVRCRVSCIMGAPDHNARNSMATIRQEHETEMQRSGSRGTEGDVSHRRSRAAQPIA